MMHSNPFVFIQKLRFWWELNLSLQMQLYQRFRYGVSASGNEMVTENSVSLDGSLAVTEMRYSGSAKLAKYSLRIKSEGSF